MEETAIFKYDRLFIMAGNLCARWTTYFDKTGWNHYAEKLLNFICLQLKLPTSIRLRSSSSAEYCLLPASVAFFPHEVNHVISEKHGGRSEADNLAFSCWRCNRRKGSGLGSFAPETGEFSLLFNPRTQNWTERFTHQAEHIIGVTPEGRTTVNLLQLNSDERLTERRLLSKS